MGMSRKSRPRRAPRSLAVVVAAAALWASDASAQVSLFEPRFDAVRKASVAWDNRPGPAREVVDVVCLVPDVATFFEAVAAWDDKHYFPVLIDDVETTMRFLRAFRPARVVRYPRKPAAAASDEAWPRALAAVGKAWVAEAEGVAPPQGDALPTSLGPAPSGLVLSSPDSPRLAAAVALAAGRFQPLLRWETKPKGFKSDLTADEARDLALNLEALVADRVSKYDALGDDCDFVTLAGDYPFRYADKDGMRAFDDLILRNAGGERWGYAGRLTGDAVHGVYAAMCSLFLRPNSALLFNAYVDPKPPWPEYAMTNPAARLGRQMQVTHRQGERAGLGGWHQVFDPVSRFGLVLVNTSGDPTTFNLAGGQGQTADVPETGPAAVAMIHSWSAESPEDPQTIAGRWLANGAFVVYGSMWEPYLQAFRTPGLVATFLAENLPLVTAVRRTAGEPYGHPWRLVYLGDPLYRIGPAAAEKRLPTWAPVDAWPAYAEYRQPEADASEALRLNWALKTAIFRSQTGVTPQRQVDLPATLLGIARDRLDASLRPYHDALLIDTLLHAGRHAELLDRLTRVPPAERSPDLRRHLETSQTHALMRAAAAKDFRQAVNLWSDVIRAPGSRGFAQTFTTRVGALADGDLRLRDWRGRLLGALRDGADPENRPAVEAELKRVEAQLEAVRGR
jgi:hypothetical protein